LSLFNEKPFVPIPTSLVPACGHESCVVPIDSQLACTQNSEAIVYRHQHWFYEVYDIDLSTKDEPRNYHKRYN